LLGARRRSRRANGKVAIVAAMHKLLTVLNAMLKSKTAWQHIPAG
jgi:hypothetical protein